MQTIAHLSATCSQRAQPNPRRSGNRHRMPKTLLPPNPIPKSKGFPSVPPHPEAGNLRFPLPATRNPTLSKHPRSMRRPARSATTLQAGLSRGRIMGEKKSPAILPDAGRKELLKQKRNLLAPMLSILARQRDTQP